MQITLANTVRAQPPIVHAAILFVTLIPLYTASYYYHLRHPYGVSWSSQKPSNSSSGDFIRDWLDTQVISPFNPYPIKWYCNQSEWDPNLVFNLPNANGGIGNIRGNMLDFFFFAIEAGASIILPDMAHRSDTDLSDLWASRSQFDDMFDEDWFLNTLAEACPHMAIYKPQMGKPIKEGMPGLYLHPGRRIDKDGTKTKTAYLDNLHGWLNGNEGYSKDNMSVVNLERTLWEVDTRSLPMGLRRNFGQILRTPEKIRRLAAVVVKQLSLRYKLDIDPKAAIPPKAFYGAHLRTESDAMNAGWLEAPNTNFSAQTDAYIQQSLAHNLRTIYVATGDGLELDLFRDKALAHHPPLNVTSKIDLLPQEDADELKELSWDQQALVDYEVLQRCSVFGGFVRSSFSYHIALARNQWLEDQGRVVDPFLVHHTEEGAAFDDGVSRVISRDEMHEGRIPRGMWP